ncbi:MAG: Mur ligase family protein [Clostridia bacterium]|jgi:UDP-N-acetylmuramyl pentapeptide synthase|nr:Mur ligase family protein [Clostridia bacterium]
MKYTFKDLEKILEAKDYQNIKDEEVFTHLNVCKISSEEIENDMSNVLFFPTYVTKEEKERDGWYISVFNRREIIKDIIKNNPKWTYVLDQELLDQIDKDNLKFIKVEDIRKSIDNIYRHRLESSSAKIIALTGSVGKTTTVGMVHDIIKKEHKALRLYSKRLTPLNIKGRIINYLEDDTEFIALEMSIYDKDHVEKLTELLPPDISAIMNVEDSHSDQPGLNSRDNIAYYKSKIFLKAKQGIVNRDDEVLKKLNIIGGDQKNMNVLRLGDRVIGDTAINSLQDVSKDSIKGYKVELKAEGIRLFNGEEEHLIKPYIYTKLFVEQALTSLTIALNLNINIDEAVESINNYKPVEKRINQEQILGKNMFFDADITTLDRLNKVAENYYNDTTMIVRKINIGEKKEIDEDKLMEIFNKFGKVYVYQDADVSKDFLENLSGVDNISIVKTEEGLSEELADNDDEDRAYFYHYGGYYRKFETLDEENLMYKKEDSFEL